MERPAHRVAQRGRRAAGSDILVVHRSDGSGTTYVFSDYLGEREPGLGHQAGQGEGTAVARRTRREGERRRQRPGEADAGRDRLHRARLRDTEQADDGRDQERERRVRGAEHRVGDRGRLGCRRAKLPPNTDYRVSIVNAPGKGVYPISSFTWIIAYGKQADSAKGQKLTDFLRWALTDGQGLSAALDYAPLPEAMRTALASKVDSIQ